jgi:Bacterial Ig-like domain (group 2)
VTGLLGLRRTTLAGLLAIAAIPACQGGTEPPQPPPPNFGRLIVSANVAGTPIATVVVEVTASDITNPLVFNLTLANGRAEGTITMPAGSARKITIRAYDAAGIETHRGSATVDVREGNANTSVSISVLSLGGDQPIVAQLSTHTVTVTGAASVVVGASVAFAAVVKDADGNVVLPNGELKWATNNPAIATVSASGDVTGVKIGSATIMATYRGVGHSAAINVVAAVVP